MVATRKAVKGLPPIDQENDQKLDVPIDDFSPVDEIAELMGDLGDGEGYDISVNALVGRKLEWLFDFAPSDMSVRELRAYLRDEHGGGDFKIVVRRNGVFVSHKTISIRAKKISSFPVSGVQAVPAPQVDRLAEIVGLMQQQMQQSQQNMQMMMMEHAKESARQQVETMRMFIESGGKGKDLDIVGVLSLAKDLFKGRDNSVELLLKGIELAKELNPEKESDGGGSGLSAVLEKLGVPLASLAAAYQSNKAAPGDARQIPGGEADNVAADEEQMNLIQQAQIRAAAGMFIRAAEKGSDVDSYADIFCDQYGDQVPDEFIQDVNEFNKIFEVVPEAAVHREWFENLRVACDKILFEVGEE